MRTKIIFLLISTVFSSFIIAQTKNDAILKEIKVKAEQIKVNIESYTQVAKNIEAENKTFENYIAYYSGDNLVMVKKIKNLPDKKTKLIYMYDNNALIYARKTDVIENTKQQKIISEFFFNNEQLITAFIQNQKVAEAELSKYQEKVYVKNSELKTLIGK